MLVLTSGFTRMLEWFIVFYILFAFYHYDYLLLFVQDRKGAFFIYFNLVD